MPAGVWKRTAREGSRYNNIERSEMDRFQDSQFEYLQHELKNADFHLSYFA